MKKRDYFLLITLFLILFSINLNAQLPDIRLEAKAEGNNVILNWVYYIPCEENWQCSDWSSCVNNKQTRTCNDLNDCNTFINKPSETKICIITQKTK